MSKHCQRCLQPYDNWDSICNQCKQIEAIERQTQTINNFNNSINPYGGSGGFYSGGPTPTWVLILAILAAITCPFWIPVFIRYFIHAVLWAF